MNAFTLRLGIISFVLFICAPAAQSASTLYAVSMVCTRGANATCESDERYGDPARSSISRQTVYVPTGGGTDGWNYTTEVAATAGIVSFALYARAAGNTFGTAGPIGTQGSAQAMYHDELRVGGTGSGTIVVPWHITGSFDLLATSGGLYTPGAGIGASFCQSIPVGSYSGGKACLASPQISYTTSGDVDQTLLLEYAINFGVTYSLNTTFTLTVVSGQGLVTGMSGDFSHTGLQQPASVYDSNHNLILNPEITAASGVDYLNPQASAVPAPGGLGLLITGLVGLGWRGTRHRPDLTL